MAILGKVDDIGLSSHVSGHCYHLLDNTKLFTIKDTLTKMLKLENKIYDVTQLTKHDNNQNQQKRLDQPLACHRVPLSAVTMNMTSRNTAFVRLCVSR